MIEEKVISKGSGRPISKRRADLESSKLMELMEKYTQVEIGKMFNVSHRIVHEILTREFKNKSIGFEVIIPICSHPISEDKLDSIGAWKELKESELYKKIMI